MSSTVSALWATDTYLEIAVDQCERAPILILQLEFLWNECARSHARGK